MESKEEIDDNFRKKIEELDKKFIENLGSPEKNKNLKELEENYKKELYLAKKNYEKKYASYLENQKKIFLKKEKKDEKVKKQERLKVKPLKLKLTRREKLKAKWELFSFRRKIKMSVFLNQKIPSPLKTAYFKVKIKNKSFLILRKNLAIRTLKRMKDKTWNFLVTSKNFILKIMKKIFLKLKKIITWPFKKIAEIRKKKKEGKGEEKEKNPEQDLVNKILKNQDKS